MPKEIKKEFYKFLKDLEIADAIINRDGIIADWLDNKFQKQSQAHQKEMEALVREIDGILEKVILEDAVIEFNASDNIEPGEKFDIEKLNFANNLLNKSNGFIFDKLKDEVIEIAQKHNINTTGDEMDTPM